MSDGRTRFPWVRVEAAWLAEQSANARVPLWARVALASWLNVNSSGRVRYGRLGLGGHTASTWTAGDGKVGVDPLTGELVEPSHLRRARREAESRGWIGGGSTDTRAQVPRSVLSVGKVVDAPWRKLHRGFIESQMSSSDVPGWMRVSLASYAHLTPSGAAPFAAGELARVTGVANVRDALRQAMTNGWVAEGSTATRVVVSPDVVSVGYPDPVLLAVA